MHPFLAVLFLLLPLSAAAALPPDHHIYTTSYLRDSAQQPSPQAIEVSRPLPYDSITPSCTLPILSNSFGNDVATYTPPSGCRRWSHAVLQLSGACNGSQSDKIAGVWLGGVELLRTSTPKPASNGIFWNVRKDVSRYSSLLRKSNVSLAVMLEKTVDGVNRGVYQLNLTFLYYDVAGAATGTPSTDFPLSLPSAEGLRQNSEVGNLMDWFNLNGNPSDLIIPISSNGDEGFWFKIQSEFDSVRKGIQIPINAYRAVIELYISSHENDEFWYSNPPNSYIEKNQLPTKKGNGAYREIQVKIDDTSVGSLVPFPVIYPGGINPLYWKPLVPIGAFDLPSYQLELTPFLSTLLDGRNHTIEIQVIGAISYWLVDANLHLWLDGGADKVVAGMIRNRYPSSRVQRSEQFKLLDGRAVVQGKRQGEFAGWVSYSAGNFTTRVEHNFEVENIIEFKKGGAEKLVKQKVEMKTKVRVEAYRQRISDMKVKSKYYLQITDTKMRSLAKDTNLTYGKMENRLKEEKVNGQSIKELDNTQKCNGWLLLRDEDILSGTAATFHEFEEKDRVSCYRRRAFADGGVVKNDTAVRCSRAPSW